MMHGHGKSDHAVVAGKPANNAGRSAAEPVEPRAGTKGNTGQQSVCRTQGRANASQALERIRQAFAVWTRGRSRMRESCMYGSERGARGNSRPYRDRREFIALLGGAAVWPLAAHGQQKEHVRRIGFLLGLAENDPEGLARITAFHQGLEALGWTETRNIRIDYRFAGGDPERVRAYVAELVASAPDLIVAHSTPVVVALKQATSTIPIVFAVVNDSLGQSLIANLAHPGGNITGFTFVDFEMIGKWLELLKEIAPGVVRAGLMFNPDLAPYFHYLREF